MVVSTPASVIPALGYASASAIPCMGVGYCQTHPMREKTPRQVLSENLRALMATRSDLSTIKKVADASDSALSNGKVGRIYAASHTTDIDALQALAEVFGVEPWQLLIEGLNPLALPRLADAFVLAQILDAVGRKEIPDKPAHPVETTGAMRPTPALDVATQRTGGSKSEVKGKARAAGRVPKPRAGRRA